MRKFLVFAFFLSYFIIIAIRLAGPFNDPTSHLSIKYATQAQFFLAFGEVALNSILPGFVIWLCICIFVGWVGNKENNDKTDNQIQSDQNKEEFFNKIQNLQKKQESESSSNFISDKQEQDVTYNFGKLTTEQRDHELILEKERLAQIKKEEDRLAKIRIEQEEEAARKSLESKITNLFSKYPGSLKSALEHVYRESKKLNKYGLPNPEVVPSEIQEFVIQLMKLEGENYFTLKISQEGLKNFPDFYLNVYHYVYREFVSMKETLDSKSISNPIFENMTGVEFEEYLMKFFNEHGYEASMTKTSGDMGGDILAIKGARRIIIQAKRWKGTVGTKAIQEAHTALTVYNATEAWVITNSKFTSQAIKIAQDCNVRLIDGVQLLELKIV